MESAMHEAGNVAPARYLCLDYAALVSEYENRLETIERGFGMDAEFLDVWVPDDDHARSVFYLFEAASLRRLPGLSVILRLDLLASIDGEGLLGVLRTLGGLHIARGQDHVTLTVSFDGLLGEASGLDDIRGLSSLHRAYRDRLVRETRTLTHRLDFTLDAAVMTYSEAGLRVVQAPFQDGTVLAAIDPTDQVVRAMRYADIPDSAGARMLDLFCRLLEGSPIQEVAEHGAIRLENSLRDPLKPPSVRGLIAPETAGAEFVALNNLARHLFHDYCNEYGRIAERNCWEQPVSLEWLALPRQLRIETITKNISLFLESRQLTKIKACVTGLVNDTQVFVTLEGCDSEKERRTLFRLLEKYLKARAEPHIELYSPPAPDRLRRNEQSELVRGEKGISR